MANSTCTQSAGVLGSSCLEAAGGWDFFFLFFFPLLYFFKEIRLSLQSLSSATFPPLRSWPSNRSYLEWQKTRLALQVRKEWKSESGAAKSNSVGLHSPCNGSLAPALPRLPLGPSATLGDTQGLCPYLFLRVLLQTLRSETFPRAS